MRYLHGVDYKWVILAVTSLILFFSMGAGFAFGVMLKPMQEELHWSRTALSLVQTTYLLVFAVGMVVIGRLVDRYSLRLALAIGLALISGGVGLLGWASAKWEVFLLYGVVFAMGSGATSISSISVLISRWFEKGRGLASSVAIAGGATGQLIVIGLLSTFLVTIGWRAGFKLLGLSVLLLLPMVLLLIRSWPPNRSSTALSQGPSAEGESTHQTTASPDVTGPPSVRRAMKSRAFVLLALIYLMCGFQDFLVITHVVAFATDQGVGPVLAGNLLALMGIMGMVGVLIAGIMADAFGPIQPMRLCFVLRIAIFSLIIVSQSTTAILVFTLAYGFTNLMTAALTPVFVGRLFGVTNMGLFVGAISMAHQISGGAGAFVGGFVFDNFGSYHWAFVLAFALSLAATAVTFIFREWPTSGVLAISTVLKPNLRQSYSSERPGSFSTWENEV